MGAFLIIVGFIMFIIFLLISLINLFRKKSNKKIVKLMSVGVIFFVSGVILVSNSNDTSSENNKANIDVKEIVEECNNNENVDAEYITSLRDIYAEKNRYIEEEIICGPLKVLSNDIERGVFGVSPSLGDGFINYDEDIYIEVYYKEMPNEKQWRNMQSQNRPVIYVRGIVSMYSSSDNIYIFASDINENFNSDWIIEINTDSVKQQEVQMTVGEYYNKGKQLLNENKKEDYEKAYNYFENELEIEPDNID